MTDLSAIEDIVLPRSDEEQVRIGDLWETHPRIVVWLRHYA